MKAAVCTRYGSPEVLKIQEVDKPEPATNQVLIQSKFTSVTVADTRVRGFRVPPTFWIPGRLALGIIKPRQPILGGEVSGVVEEVGANVKIFKKGDRVFAFQGHHFGTNAEYVCIDEEGAIAKIPDNLTFEQAAALPFGGTTALYFLQKAGLRKGEKILIYGASGSVGTYAVQLAKHFGAEVTAICSQRNIDLVKSLGADRVIDYTRKDFHEAFSNAKQEFDVVLECTGKVSIKFCINALKPGGRFMHLVATPGVSLRINLALLGSRKKFIGGTFNATAEQMNTLRNLAEKGKIHPVMDRTYPFEEIVDAHRYVDLGHKRGNVILKM